MHNRTNLERRAEVQDLLQEHQESQRITLLRLQTEDLAENLTRVVLLGNLVRDRVADLEAQEVLDLNLQEVDQELDLQVEVHQEVDLEVVLLEEEDKSVSYTHLTLPTKA